MLVEFKRVVSTIILLYLSMYFCWVLLPPTHMHSFVGLTFLPVMSRHEKTQIASSWGGLPRPHYMHGQLCVFVCVRFWCVCMHALRSCMIGPVFPRDLHVFCVWMCLCMADVCVGAFMGYMYMWGVCVIRQTHWDFCLEFLIRKTKCNNTNDCSFLSAREECSKTDTLRWYLKKNK